MPKRYIKWVVFVLLLVGGAVWLFRANRQPPRVILEPNNASLVALGKRQYAIHCATCHGAELEGQRQAPPSGPAAPAHDQTGHTWHHPDPVLLKITKYGGAALSGGGYQSNMPGFAGSLNDEEIKAVLSYIKSSWPEEIKKRHDRINARSR